MIYKGNIIFIINEYGKSEIQLQAFLSKATTKMIMRSILNYSFPQLFPNGFKSYGGTASTKRAKILTINYEQQPQQVRYFIQIEEGKGQVTKTGGIKPINRETSVRTYLDLHDALEMAHEVIDFINHQELISLINDQPLYSYYEFKQQTQEPYFSNNINYKDNGLINQTHYGNQKQLDQSYQINQEMFYDPVHDYVKRQVE